MNDTYSSVISMPDTMQTSYQIQTSGKNPVYTVVSGYTAKVSETGLVTPKMQYVTYVDKNGNDVKSQWEYMFGETLISVQDGNSTVYYKFILKDYAEYYAEQKMDTFLKENITAEMSDYKRLRRSPDGLPTTLITVSIIPVIQPDAGWRRRLLGQYQCSELYVRKTGN